jgi:hypothetical protein
MLYTLYTLYIVIYTRKKTKIKNKKFNALIYEVFFFFFRIYI